MTSEHNDFYLIHPAPSPRDVLPQLIECALMLAAQCRVAGDVAHANMYQARANAGAAALAVAELRS